MKITTPEDLTSNRDGAQHLAFSNRSPGGLGLCVQPDGRFMHPHYRGSITGMRGVFRFSLGWSQIIGVETQMLKV